MLFQIPYLFPGTVRDNLSFCCSGKQEFDADFHLRRVGLKAEYADMGADDLSVGEKQRVALARALVNRPLVVLADEPFATLDLASRQELMRLAQRLCRGERCALLCATEGKIFSPLADRVVALPEPEVVRENLPDDFVTMSEVASRSSGDLLSDLYEAEFHSLAQWLGPFVNLVLRPAFFALVVAVVITYLCYFGLTMARLGRAGLPANAGKVAVDSVGLTVQYLGGVLHGDLGTYSDRRGVFYWAMRNGIFAFNSPDGIRRKHELG